MAYEYEGTWRVENLLVLGLAADTGEIGVRGIAPGDLRDSDGRGAVCAAEMLKESLGRVAARAAYILTVSEIVEID